MVKTSIKFIFIYTLIFQILHCQSFISKKIIDTSYLNCEELPIYKNLEISTNLNEESDEYNIHIMKDCQIDENWRVKTEDTKQCVIPQRVYEGEDNIRRSFRFTYHKNNLFKDKITISKISLNYPKNVAESSLTKDSLDLFPGESHDVYVDYDCLDMHNNKSSEDWFKIRIDVEFDNFQTKSFEYIKICNASYHEKLDFSHILIIACVFLIVYASINDYLKSKVEGIIVEKFTEIKNPENLMLISFVTGAILIFFGTISKFSDLIYYVLIIVGPLCISMICEAILRKNNILTHLDGKTFEFAYLGSISLFSIACIGIGLFLFFIWLESQNWFINNIFSITISIISIRIFKFTSFKFMASLYTFAILFDYFWVIYRSNYYDENFKLTNNPPLNLPINILCPEMISSPFYACNSLPVADIILPGVFLMYNRKFDESKYINNYFYLGIGAFGFGLIINLMIYYTYMLPTPSFLLTGPSIMILTLLIAYKRDELKEYVEGFSSIVYQNPSDVNLNSYFENQRKNTQMNYRPPIEMDQYDEDETNNDKK